MSEETYDNITLVCPHCGHRESNPNEIFSEMEETIEEYTCSSCEGVYTADRQITFHYTGRPKSDFNPVCPLHKNKLKQALTALDALEQQEIEKGRWIKRYQRQRFARIELISELKPLRTQIQQQAKRIKKLEVALQKIIDNNGMFCLDISREALKP